MFAEEILTRLSNNLM